MVVFLEGVRGVLGKGGGVAVMPLALASIAGGVIGGQLITKTGRYWWIALASAAIMIAGLLLLACWINPHSTSLDIHSTSLDIVVALLVLGPGVGSGLSLYTITAQNAMPGKVGQATSAVVFFPQLC